MIPKKAASQERKTNSCRNREKLTKRTKDKTPGGGGEFSERDLFPRFRPPLGFPYFKFLSSPRSFRGTLSVCFSGGERILFRTTTPTLTLPIKIEKTKGSEKWVCGGELKSAYEWMDG